MLVVEVQVLLTMLLLHKILRFKIEDPNLMSDHCVIDFTFIFGKCMYINNNDNKNTCKNNNNENICDDQENVRISVNYKYMYVWDSTLRDEYVINLGSQDTFILLDFFTATWLMHHVQVTLILVFQNLQIL